MGSKQERGLVCVEGQQAGSRGLPRRGSVLIRGGEKTQGYNDQQIHRVLNRGPNISQHRYHVLSES
jgi:hypothetical protein